VNAGNEKVEGFGMFVKKPRRRKKKTCHPGTEEGGSNRLNLKTKVEKSERGGRKGTTVLVKTAMSPSRM